MNVYDHTANHYYQTLPGLFASEFIGFRRFFQLFLIHALVDHARYFYIAAKRNPS